MRYGNGRRMTAQLKIALTFEGAGADEEPVNDIGLQRLRPLAGDGRFHAPYVLAVSKKLDRRGSRIGDQMPEGDDRLIGLPLRERNHFHFGELRALSSESKKDHRRGVPEPGRRWALRIGNLKGFVLEPGGKIMNI